jgi:hypothetical protein
MNRYPSVERRPLSHLDPLGLPSNSVFRWWHVNAPETDDRAYVISGIIHCVWRRQMRVPPDFHAV